jgi:t-SNARE complex subunit (syntaxin)
MSRNSGTDHEASDSFESGDIGRFDQDVVDCIIIIIIIIVIIVIVVV